MNKNQEIDFDENCSNHVEEVKEYLDKSWLNTPGDIEDFVFYYTEEKTCEK